MFDPTETSPTTPYNYRPMVGPGFPGGQPEPYYAPPSETPPLLPRVTPGGLGRPMGDRPFDDVLERVESDWAGAMQEEESPGTRATGESRATPFADHILTGQQMEPWGGLVDEVGRRLGVPRDVGMALVQTVSGGKPDFQAGGGRAVGLAGVPREHAPGVDLSNPTANLTTAFARLRSAHDRLGDWDRAALAVTGFGDARGEPRVLGNGVDGFGYRDRFRAARRQHQSGAPRGAPAPGYEES